MPGTVDPSTLPPDGWRCLDVTDLGSAIGDCDRCGKEKIRFVHHLEHPDWPSILSVGRICAGEMLRDAKGVDRRERRLKARVLRKQRWLRRKWKTRPDRSVALWWRSQELAIFQITGGPDHNRWAFAIDGEFHPNTYHTPLDAKSALFDLLWSGDIADAG